MATAAPAKTDSVDRVVRRVAHRLDGERRVCMRVPGGGRLHLDRRLPFVAVHRRPAEGDDHGTADVVTALASHLLLHGDPEAREEGRQVLRGVMEGIASALGAALVLEVWTERRRARAEAEPDRIEEDSPAPSVRLVVGPGLDEGTVRALERALRGLRMCPENGGELGVASELTSVTVARETHVAPPGLEPLLDASDPRLHLVGLELSPFYRDPRTERAHPRVVQALRGALARALEDAFFTFAGERTSLDAPHPRALARRSLGRAALHVDGRLGEVFGAFDTLLQVTPVNAEEAWARFRSSGHSDPPTFLYRPLPFDPEHLKRRLFGVPIERVEDPLLNHLFREKQEELDREITLLRELGTARFLPASVQLHGGADEGLVRLAREILRRLDPPGEDGEEYAPDHVEPRAFVDAHAFAAAARREIDAYRAEEPRFTAGVQVRGDVAAGLMVSRGVLRVSETLCIPRARLDPLVQHEIGTHVVTYYNGTRQPLRILASGLAGYEPLQEGLAVLSEYLVGGLSIGRMRILAGRVLGVHALLEGADFLETFRLLRQEGFEARSAFIVTTRIHRGGGYTKDAAYLRGLRALLAYLGRGGALDPLLVGKLGIAHTDAVQELVLRGVLEVPSVRPRWSRRPDAIERLEACRGMDVIDLIEEPTTTTAAARHGAG